MKAIATCCMIVALMRARDASAMTCKHASSGASYDLSSLKNGNAAYTVTGHDFPGTSTVEKSYTYTYAVCANVANPPNTCKKENEPDSPVYQTDVIGGTETCHTAARNVDSNAGTWSLLDGSNPAAGVTLQYKDSSKCCGHTRDMVKVTQTNADGTPKCLPVDPQCTGQNCAMKNSRTSRINFKCSPDKSPKPGDYVFERNVKGYASHCEYEFSVSSMWACPTECKVTDSQLCAGHGLCGYDHSNKKAKCFCDDGWMGDDCNTAGDAHMAANSGTTAALVILILLCISLVGGVWFLAKQVKAYRNDASNYMQIRNQEMGSMSVDQI